jgi:hypothetical protein
VKRDGGFVSLFDLRDRLRADQQNGPIVPVPAEPTAAPVEPPQGPDQAAPTVVASDLAAKPRKRHFKESVKDLIDAGLLEVGAELRPTSTSHKGTAIVLEDGRVRVGEQVYDSLSPAATAITGNKADPGWEFWAIDEDGVLVSLYELRERLRARSVSQ